MLFLFDYGSDIYVAAQYWKNGEMWWFSLTLILVSVPSIMVNITAIIQQADYWKCIVGVLQLSIIVRYMEVIAPNFCQRFQPAPQNSGQRLRSARQNSGQQVLPASPNSEDHTFLLAKLRYMEAITESAPQLCLQVYIMLRQWSFPSYTVFSSVLSLLSLVWSIFSLEKERAKKKEENYFNLREQIWFLIWQMSTLISRLFAIVFLVYLSRYALFFLAVHCFLIIMLRICFGFRFSTFSVTYLSVFHPVNLKGILSIEIPEHIMTVTYFFIHVENILLVALFLTIEHPDANMDTLKPIALWCHAVGSMISFVSFFLFHL